MVHYIEDVIEKYTNAFPTEIRVIEHMLCVNGNGVDADTFGPERLVEYDRDGEILTYRVGGYCLDPETIKGYKVVPVDSMYRWSTNERYQPFRDLLPLKGTEHWAGLQEAVRYFLKCLEISSPETAEAHILGHRFSHLYSRESLQRDIDSFANDIKSWQDNAHILRELFEV